MLDTMKRPNPKDPMRDTRLVQRLSKPFRGFPQLIDNPFSFGGGLRNGGLSEDGMAAVRSIFSFDYMGAAEFEWGIVPATLNAMVKNSKSLSAIVILVPYKDVALPWHYDADKLPEGKAPVYLIAYRDDLTEAVRRIRMWAKNKNPTSVEWEGQTHLKENTRLHDAILPNEENPTGIVGWLEVDNGFFFFTDEEMWRNTAALFGLKIPAIVT